MGFVLGHGFKNLSKLVHEEWSDYHPEIKIRSDITPFKTESRLSRREETALCRLRTGITMLTDIGPRMNGVWPQICEACDAILTIDHILINCLEYIHQRLPLVEYFRNTRQEMTRHSLLQDNENVITLLMDYLRNTNLLKYI